MSIRTEPRADLSQAMQQTLHIDPAIMQSAAAAGGPGPFMAPAPSGAMAHGTGAAMDNEQHLAAANDFNTSNPQHPLKRTVVINIRASLSDLCLRKQKATWAPPSADATRAIFQQKKAKYPRCPSHTLTYFACLSPSLCLLHSSPTSRAPPRPRATSRCEALPIPHLRRTTTTTLTPLFRAQSVVLHQMDMASQKSTFPIALGVRITGVDDSTFSQTGEAYSAISLPNADTHVSRSLQQDDTALAYEAFVTTQTPTHTRRPTATSMTCPPPVHSLRGNFRLVVLLMSGPLGLGQPP